MSTPLIGRFEHLPKRPKSDEARPLLEKIASQVKPIMTKRNWKVGTLAEFLPADPALLGVNTGAGHRINLRLRPPGDPSTFYEFDQLVLVMLHELTHNVHGPHDAKFYKLLAELEEEFYELKRKGYSGEGFHGEGNHLPGIKLNEYEGRAKGLQAAQKRFDVQKTMGKGGVLGGSNVKGRSMKEVLAEAAERRMRDDKSCKTQDHGQSKEVQDEVRKAQEESVGVDAIDLTGDSDDEVQVVDVQPKVKLEPKALDATETTSPSQPIQPPNLRAQQSPQKAKAAGSTVRKTHTSAPYPPPRQPAPAPKSPRPEEPLLTLPSGEWSCPTCTLLNGPRSLACEACTTPKPRPTQSKKGNSWWCEFCGAGPRDMEFWSCLECGWVRKWG